MSKECCLLCAGEPAIEDGRLCKRQIFVEANAHAQARADVDDTRRKFDFFTSVRQAHSHDSLNRRGIERVDVATGAADILISLVLALKRVPVATSVTSAAAISGTRGS